MLRVTGEILVNFHKCIYEKIFTTTEFDSSNDKIKTDT